VACEQADYPTARKLFEEGLVIQRELGDKLAIASSLEGLAAVMAALGKSPRAASIWGAAARLRIELAAPINLSERSRYDRQIAAARAALRDDIAFDRAWQKGSVLALERAIEYAIGATDDT
jgi:hypothetical protein